MVCKVTILSKKMSGFALAEADGSCLNVSILIHFCLYVYFTSEVSYSTSLEKVGGGVRRWQ